MWREATVERDLLPGHVDPSVWAEPPPIPSSGRSRIGGGMALRALGLGARRAGISLEMNGGPVAADGPPVIVVRDPEAMAARLADDFRIGFGDAFVAGEWTARDPAAVLVALEPWSSGLFTRALGGGPVRSLERARARITQHIASRADGPVTTDAPLDLVGLYTGETLSTGPALFASAPRTRISLPEGGEEVFVDPPTSAPAWTVLADAQRRRIDEMLDRVGVRAGSRLLVVSPDRGELVVRAAERGARVTLVVRDPDEMDLVEARFLESGVVDRIDAVFGGPEMLTGQFDRILLMDRPELGGPAAMGELFAIADRLLAPGGRIGFLAMVVGPEGAGSSTRASSWTRLRVWPTFRPPSLHELWLAVRRNTSLGVVSRVHLGAHHAETCRLWAENLRRRDAEAAIAGYPPSARLLWRYHLAMLEASLRCGRIDTEFVTLGRDLGSR